MKLYFACVYVCAVCAHKEARGQLLVVSSFALYLFEGTVSHWLAGELLGCTHLHFLVLGRYITGCHMGVRVWTFPQPCDVPSLRDCWLLGRRTNEELLFIIS